MKRFLNAVFSLVTGNSIETNIYYFKEHLIKPCSDCCCHFYEFITSKLSSYKLFFISYPKSFLKNLIITIFALTTLHLFTVYNSFFENRLGYIYDPKSGDLYWLKLSPTINPSDYWKHLLPFVNHDYFDISYVMTKQKFKFALVFEHLSLLNKNIFENTMVELDKKLQAEKEQGIEFTKATYFIRSDLNVKTMLPPEWSRLPEHLGDDLNHFVIPADVVIASYSPKKNGVMDVQSLRGVLFISNTASQLINEYCFYESDDTWEECALLFSGWR